MTMVAMAAATANEAAKDGGAALVHEPLSPTPKRDEEQRVDVHGMIMDDLYGKRLRKCFGSRSFWGTVVGCYWVGRGLFYKVSFDDGDVDILSAEEVQDDVANAERHRKEDPEASKAETSPTSVDGDDGRELPYRQLIRSTTAVKRRREEVAPCRDEHPKGSWDVQLWGRRLYATIVTQKEHVIVNEFVRMANGDPGEMEATGKVNPDD
ncbi:hypothetical protein P43SY_007489 [Pythium insidiosum]|uniref:Uncharacterized protein n=1 Tax=Pythium insidiosum TaxID=114742 RepID=A0AAD5LZ91_PYTIN|nr:hypothetical protein P43SY_007489 [Pythium insidiosum]